MNTLITSTGNTLDSKFDLRFGRAKWFCMYNEEEDTFEFIENPNINLNSGVGIKTSEKIIELGAQKVISGDFGPKAKDTLNKFNIQMVIIKDDDCTIESIINKLKNARI